MPFGQVVLGPPGSGKTVYCHGMQQFLTGIGRKVAVINLDPANDAIPYECAVNITEIVKVEDIMDKMELGPNGALVYIMEFVEQNWESVFKPKLEILEDCYVIIDCPGQVELYTHHQSMRNIFKCLEKQCHFRLAAIHLIDSFVCSQPSLYISALLLSLNAMLHLELPHINVLSKIDMIGTYGKLDFNLDFYTEVQDLHRLQQYLDRDPLSKKFKKLNNAICELIHDFRIVSFHTLNIQDKESVYNLVKLVDKSNGFVYGGLFEGNESIMTVQETETGIGQSLDIQEKYYKDDNEWDI